MLEVKLLGGFQVTSDGEPIAAVNTPRLQSLLAYLCLRRGAPQSRQTLAFMLWPESAESQARTNLRTLLHRLRAALPQADSFLSLETQTVLWRAGPAYRLDVDEFESALHAAAHASAASAQAHLERAAELYQGQLFPECYDDWVLPERERLHQMALGALERLVDHLEGGANLAAALERARRLLLLDPLRESTSLSLMRLHQLQGQRAAALRVYHQHAATLRDELAVEPSPAMLAAYAQLTSAGPAVPSAPDPLANRFPIVGREAEQARMRSMWQTAAQGRPYLLVLEGEAGLGKTRLAEDVLAWAERQGAAAAVARCYAAEGDLAYAPVTAWLRSDAIRPRLARLDDIWLAEVARLLPEVLSARPHLASPGPLTEGWTDGARQFARDFATQAPQEQIRTVGMELLDLKRIDDDLAAWQ